MTLTLKPIPAMGDNLAPLISGQELESHLQMTYAENLERAQALLAKGVEFETIPDDEVDSAATEFMVKLRACWKTGEGARQSEKAPYDDNAGLVHAWFKNGILDPLTALGAKINGAQTKFKVAKAEVERKRREEEARVAAEAERKRREEAARAEAAAREAERNASRKRNEEVRAAAEAESARLRAIADAAREAENKAAEERAKAQESAAAPMAELSRARGERGGISSLREKPDFRDLDRDKLDLEILRAYLPDKALEQAIRGLMDANKAMVATAIKNGTQPIKGVTIFMGYSNSGRA